MFWKHGIGNIYRVDFESDDSVNVYIKEEFEWNAPVIKSLEETGKYVLNFTTFDGSVETWTIHVNPNPTPMATSNKNVHQLEYENELLRVRIQELENTTIQELENATFEDLMQMIFVEWVLYDPEEIKKAKVRLCDVCPHHDIVDDYVEYGLEDGKYIKYCDVCMKCV